MAALEFLFVMYKLEMLWLIAQLQAEIGRGGTKNVVEVAAF
jgi:hypothetical protein